MIKFRYILCLIMTTALLCPMSLIANVTFKFSNGTIDAGELKMRMENNIFSIINRNY